MKKFISLLVILLVVSCEPDTRPPRLVNPKVLYITSCRKEVSGGGRFPITCWQHYTVSSKPSARDTVMTIDYQVKSDQEPMMFNLGDTLHLDFKR